MGTNDRTRSPDNPSDEAFGKALAEFKREEISESTIRSRFPDIEGLDAIIADARAIRSRDVWPCESRPAWM